MKMICRCPELTDEEFQALDLEELLLTGRSFYEARTPMLSHFPVAPEMRIEKILDEIGEKGYQLIHPLRILFADGMFFGKIMVEIESPGRPDNKVVTYGDTKLIGKVYEGPRYLVPKALKEFDLYLLKEQQTTIDYYFRYLSCQACQKAKKTKTVIYARIR